MPKDWTRNEICFSSSSALSKSLEPSDMAMEEKNFDLLRQATPLYHKAFRGQVPDVEMARHSLLREEDDQPGVYDKPLPCFGCGIGWFSFLSGFIIPLMWYWATILYFGNYYRKDPRERAGLAASALAAMGCSVMLLIIIVTHLF